MIKFCNKELNKSIADSYESYIPAERNLILPMRLKYKEYDFVRSVAKELSAEFPTYTSLDPNGHKYNAVDYFVLIMPTSPRLKK